jgi:plastocyanin
MMNIRNFRGNNLFILAFPLFMLASCSGGSEKYIPKTDTVIIAQMKFRPAELTVHKGDTVVWINRDIVAHDVTQVPNSAWTSGSLAPGQSWKMAVQETDDYFCSIHIVMVGKVVAE